jgi:hypothetical protein
MSEPQFQIGADGIDAEAIVARIQETVARKMASGAYADPRVARAERLNLANIRNEDGAIALYLNCLREAVYVDINDFEIVERRARFARPLVALKKTIWNLLKFYTYRLWSQQNEVNGLLLAAIEGQETEYRDKLRNLEERVARLEKRIPPE